MFSNSGGKIKTLARIICVLGIVISIFGGLILIIQGASFHESSLTVTGVLVLFAGTIGSWIGSFFAYGFGELIENTTVIAELAAKADAEKNKAE